MYVYIYIPRGSTYTTIMELGPRRPSPLWFWGPNSIVVVYMDPLGYIYIYYIIRVYIYTHIYIYMYDACMYTAGSIFQIFAGPRYRNGGYFPKPH